MCEHDYAHKYTENEEDERSCMYRYIRNELDDQEINNTRVFLSYSFRIDGNILKPDIMITSHDNGFKNIKTEAIVEMKNWPNEDSIKKDIKKLINYGKALHSETPALFFVGILGNSFNNVDVDNFISNSLNEDSVVVMLRKHSDLYKGPWCNVTKKDPWRAKYRS
jgi:hypothetical protein